MAYSGQIDWIRSFTPRLVGLSNDVISLGRAEPALTHVSRFVVIAENEAKQVSFRNISGSLQEIGGLLVKRGTAMGPLVPSLALCPILLLFAWLFRSVALVGNIPMISVVMAIAALWIVADYHRHYSRFAGTDPDRLQSEEYRYQTARLMVAAKKFSHPVSAQELPLAVPDANVPEPGVPLDQPAGPAEADEERVS